MVPLPNIANRKVGVSWIGYRSVAGFRSAVTDVRHDPDLVRRLGACKSCKRLLTFVGTLPRMDERPVTQVYKCVSCQTITTIPPVDLLLGTPISQVPSG